MQTIRKYHFMYAYINKELHFDSLNINNIFQVHSFHIPSKLLSYFKE